MSDPPPLPPASPPGRPRLSTRRIVVWVLVGGIGVFLFVSGVLGILEKG